MSYTVQTALATQGSNSKQGFKQCSFIQASLLAQSASTLHSTTGSVMTGTKIQKC